MPAPPLVRLRTRSLLRLPALTALLVVGLAGVAPVAVAGPAAVPLPAVESPAPGVTPTAEAPPPRLPGPPVGGPRLGEQGTIVQPVPGLPGIPKDLHPKSWLVADLDTGAVLAARDPHRRNRPASTLKTLTALTLIPLLDLKKGRAPYTQVEAEHIRQSDGRSTAVGLEPGRAYPINRLFEAMLVSSANDAAEALAGAVPGGRDAALAAMNTEAARLQARDTVAGTPSGLDAQGQYSSAYDLALIARAALRLPDFRSWTKAASVGLNGSKGPFGDSNHNRLLRSYPGAYAGKDGYTVAAGQVWWGAAQRGGHHLLVVVVDAGFTPVTEEIRLLDWGFAALTVAQPVGQLVDPLPPGAEMAGAGEVRAAAPGAPPAASTAGPRVAPAGASVAGDRGLLHGWSRWLWAPVAVALLALAVLARRRRSPALIVPSMQPRQGRGRHAAPRAVRGPQVPSLQTGAVRVLPASAVRSASDSPT